jgi:CubicO group peptidase (beta-lactamase class C family)
MVSFLKKSFGPLLVIACTVLAVGALAQPLSVTTNVRAEGFSADRLGRVKSNMDEWVRKGWINGAVAMIVRDGKIVFYNAAGYKDIDSKQLLAKDDIFRMASQTKAVTSVAVMILYEEGKFLLDDPVSKYIPAFANEKVLDKFNPADTTYTVVPAKRDITIRDLLTHTSGIAYAQIGNKEMNSIYAKNHLMAGFYVHDESLLTAINRLATLPLQHQPGEHWTYGLNTDILGCLVEIWSGMSLEDFFRKRIFEPLGMKDTYFNLPQNKGQRLVNMYIEKDGHFNKQDQVFDIDASYPLKTKTYFSGGAGLSGTIFDYTIFLQMLLNGGEYNGVRILSSNTVRMMTMNQIGDLNLDQDKFGLGFKITTEKGSSLFPNQAGTYSWGGAFSTAYWVDPKEKMITLFYRQMWGTHGSDIDNKFRVLAYQALTD